MSKKDEPDNFWNTCPRKLTSTPASICEEGKKSSLSEHQSCEWWIDSFDHNFCFWTYIKDHSRPGGSMKEHAQSEVSRLLKIPENRLHIICKEAEDALHEIMIQMGLGPDQEISSENVDAIIAPDEEPEEDYPEELI